MAVINGTSGPNTLNGTASADQIYGLEGDDTINAGAGNDQIWGGQGSDQINGGAGNDYLAPTGVGQNLVAGEVDRIDGGAGFDTASFPLDDLGLPITFSWAGLSVWTTIYAGGVAAGYIINVDALSLTLSSSNDDVSFAGQPYQVEFFNFVTGGDGDDRIIGGATTSLFYGGNGNDFIRASSADRDVVSGGTGADNLDGGAGIEDVLDYSDSPNGVTVNLKTRVAMGGDATGDTIKNFEWVTGSLFNDTFTGDDGDNWLSGFEGADHLNGGAGNDVLEGGTGLDTMTGGAGDDTYNVDKIDDVVIEGSNGGTDAIVSSVNWTLGSNFENLSLTDAAYIGRGNALNNEIVGSLGANYLDGGGGRDLLRGGFGNDIYIVDNADDNVFEYQGEGTDEIRSLISYSLESISDNRRYVENLTLIGSAAINATGNELANTLTGNAAANILDGLGGADRMIGGGGNDTYIAGAGDIITEVSGGGSDTVRTALATYVVPTAVEYVVYTGAGNFTGVGNAAGNGITGGAKNDGLNGALGADILTGGGGNDSFVFNTALGTGNIDKITDYNVAADTIVLENAILKAVGATGVLGVGQFHIGASAADSNDHIIYNKSTGALIYDSNGNAAGGAIQFATLSANLALTNKDFVVI